MRLLIAGFLVAALLPAKPTAAAADTPEFSALDLLRQCSDDPKAIGGKAAKAFCKIYVGGFAQGLKAGLEAAQYVHEESASGRSRGKRLKLANVVCWPDSDVENDQLVLIVRKWLEGHPERLHEPAAHSALFAILEAFPCK